MNVSFTQNDLIRYHYHEMDVVERKKMEKELLTNPDLMAESKKMRQTMKLLDIDRRKPSVSSIHIIMEYSRRSNTELKAFL